MSIWNSPYVLFQDGSLKAKPKALRNYKRRIEQAKAKIRKIQRNSGIREYARPEFVPKTILVKRKHAATSEAETPHG